ncbi:MAG: hypothetical protein KA821_09655 [Chitinophagaceae bacterium]|nr:hypothetical protein [Chitinophagaceae bacterium]
MSLARENFLRAQLIRYLQQLDPQTPPHWGRMSVQQMIEHLAFDAIPLASGRLKIDQLVTTPAQLPRMRQFLMSDKPFKENLRNPLLPEDPRPLRYNTPQAAISALQAELIDFFRAFEDAPLRTTRNPFFGDLNFEENVQLLYKHALHHLRQFGIDPPPL